MNQRRVLDGVALAGAAAVLVSLFLKWFSSSTYEGVYFNRSVGSPAEIVEFPHLWYETGWEGLHLLTLGLVVAAIVSLLPIVPRIAFLVLGPLALVAIWLDTLTHLGDKQRLVGVSLSKAAGEQFRGVALERAGWVGLLAASAMVLAGFASRRLDQRLA